MRAEGHDSQGGNYVYLATTEGEASYVGITDNPAARQHEHGLRHHLHVLNRNSPMTRIEVRAIEQSYIHAARRNPRNQNIANSIAAHHPYYGAAMRFGRAFLGWIRREFPRTRLRFEI
jgi:predicted GIY-YIG superfamily endonuclease